MAAAARAQRPDAMVFARAIDADHAVRLLGLGAIDVIPEAVEASLQLGGRLLEGLGVSDDAVARRLDELREQELARLKAARRKKRLRRGRCRVTTPCAGTRNRRRRARCGTHRPCRRRR